METKWCQSCMLTEIELVWNRWERNITNFIPKGQQYGSTKEKKTLKIPGGRYEQRPVSETMTLVGKDPSNFSSALKKRNFFLNWSLKIFWVRKWDLLYISISGFQIMSAGSLQRMSWFQFQVSLYRLYFYALQSSSFKYIYLWLCSLCNVHVFLSFKCIYSYFNCVHYEPLTNPSLYLILVTPSYSLAFQAKFTSSHSWEVFFWFSHVCPLLYHMMRLTWLSQTLVVNIWFFSSWNDITERDHLCDDLFLLCLQMIPSQQFVGGQVQTSSWWATSLQQQAWMFRLFRRKKQWFEFWG